MFIKVFEKFKHEHWFAFNSFQGKLLDGTEIEDTYYRNKPLIIRLGGGQVIKGLEDGLVGMCVGEIRKLIIPASMAYGTTGIAPLIPPNAILLIKIELVEIEIITGRPEPYLQDVSEQKESNSEVMPSNVLYDHYDPNDDRKDEETIRQGYSREAFISDDIPEYYGRVTFNNNFINKEVERIAQMNDANNYKVPSNTKDIWQYNTKDRYTGDGSQNADEMNYDILKQTNRDFENDVQIESEDDNTYRYDYHSYELWPDIEQKGEIKEKAEKEAIEKKVGKQEIKGKRKLKVYTDRNSKQVPGTTFIVSDPRFDYEDPKPNLNMELLENMKKGQYANKELDFCSTLYREDQDKELYLCRQAEGLILFATAQLVIRDHLVESLKEIEDMEAQEGNEWVSLYPNFVGNLLWSVV